MFEDRLTQAYIEDLDTRLANNFSDISLSQGYAGDLLLLLNHYVIYEKTVYLERINEVVEKIYYTLTKEHTILKEQSIGLWTGPFGLYYSLYKLDSYIDDSFLHNVKEEIKKSCRYLIKNNFFEFYQNDYEYSKDMIFGLAGILMAVSQTDLLEQNDKPLLNVLYGNVEAILSIYLYTEKSSKVFAPIENIHSNNNEKFVNFGYAHGLIGLCTALKKTTDIFIIFEPLYKECLDYCNNYIQTNTFRKLDIPYFIESNGLHLEHLKENNIINNLAWCNGLGGFYIFTKNCIDSDLRNEVSAALYAFVYKILNSEEFFHNPNINICHGYSGLFYTVMNNHEKSFESSIISDYLYQHFFTIKADENNFSLLYGRGGTLLVYMSYRFNTPFIGDEVFGF